MDPASPSGEEWTIRHGDQVAVVTEVGATLRAYVVAGEPVVAGFGRDEVRPHGRGQVLAPWPNRIRDGRYTWDGVEHELAHTEPERDNALHGLVGWAPWRVLDRTPTDLALGLRLHPQAGWDWTLDLTLTYHLDADGLMVTARARNLGATDAPFGYGAHPYLTTGETRVDEVALVAPAHTYCAVDAERLLPVRTTVAASRRPVGGSPYDLREHAPLGERGIDLAYTDLDAVDGVWQVRLHGPRPVTLWAESAAFPWLQVFTGDALPPSHRRTSGIAVEPLTCPPNAFVTGEDVVRLAPGAGWAGTWGITPG